MPKLTNIIINLIFYPLVAVIIAVCILLSFGIKPYITMSGSMEPEIQTGSICFVNTKVEYDEMQEGDIIAFQTATGGFVTHRVISVTKEGLETKGDNNENSDGITTDAGNFKGETLFSIPYVGYALRTLQNPRNFAIIIIVVIGLLIYNMMDSYWAKKDRETTECTAECDGKESYKKTQKKFRGKYEA